MSGTPAESRDARARSVRPHGRAGFTRRRRPLAPMASAESASLDVSHGLYARADTRATSVHVVVPPPMAPSALTG